MSKRDINYSIANSSPLRFYVKVKSWCLTLNLLNRVHWAEEGRFHYCMAPPTTTGGANFVAWLPESSVCQNPRQLYFEIGIKLLKSAPAGIERTHWQHRRHSHPLNPFTESSSLPPPPWQPSRSSSLSTMPSATTGSWPSLDQARSTRRPQEAPLSRAPKSSSAVVCVRCLTMK